MAQVNNVTYKTTCISCGRTQGWTMDYPLYRWMKSHGVIKKRMRLSCSECGEDMPEGTLGFHEENVVVVLHDA